MRKLFLFLLLVSLLSCAGDGVTVGHFCALPARFTFSPVSSQPQLYVACHSMGEWCTIRLQNRQFVFTSAAGRTGVTNQTALMGYTGFYMGLSGFIVGLPNLPEMGTDAPQVTCYELACPNCYELEHVTKPLTLQTGTAACQKCRRQYDLNNLGVIIRGDKGRGLYRYRVYFNGEGLAINN